MNGSAIPTQTPTTDFIRVCALTPNGIMAKYNMEFVEFERIRDQVLNKTLLDLLFSYPDGPRYDIILYLIATSS